MKTALAFLAAALFLLAVALLPLPIRPYLDFQVLYHADLGLLRGIRLYDHAGQVAMIAQLANVPPDRVFVLPFPYPPWYALSTLWLALLPIELAARLWFGLSALMLLMSLWAITAGWPLMKRIVLSFFAIIFPPVLGSLFVGQYGFPVLLGAGLLIQALQRKSAPLTALAAALLTFKPHLGVLILLVTLIYLWQERRDFGRGAFTAILIAGAILFAAGFLASPLWPLDYFHSLIGFKDVSQCHQCTSLPMALAGLSGGGFDQALPFAVILLVVSGGWLAWQWRRLTESTTRLVAAGTLVTFLVNPYLQNYDYVLLLVPFLVLAGEARVLDWLGLALAYALPLIALALLGPAGNISLVFSALMLAALFTRLLFLDGTHDQYAAAEKYSDDQDQNEHVLHPGPEENGAGDRRNDWND